MWEIILKYHREDYPNLLILAEMAVILPLQTCDVERGFSKQNWIKTGHRNRLNEVTLDNLMIVSCEGAPLHEFDFEGAYELWLKEKHRRILDVDITD